MIIRWTHHNPADPQPPTTIRAAQYVRMSTEHQQYSTDNQAATIATYAEKRGLEIVKTYADEGKSGLDIKGRPALRALLDDVESGRADFEVLLVYDVSRWGRFQDPDEAASYELRCRSRGVRVLYCGEPWENDGSIGSSIIKTVKRAMAGEYSRELSVKVFAGQANLIRLGFRQGGSAGFGLRRQLVDQHGDAKGVLGPGEHKSIATDRVILIPGPDEEIAIVREVYRRFVEQGESETDIANALNARGVRTDLSREWTRGTVHQLLINEKYIGNNVWARTSCKLKGKHIENATEDWVRANGVFDAIVPALTFDAAQAIIAKRSEKLSDDQMLEMLAQIFSQRGFLSGLIIDEADDCPSSSAFRSRFGSLLRAYTLVGFAPDHDYSYLEVNRRLRAMYPDILAGIIGGIEQTGGTVARDLETEMLRINGEFTVSITIARCFQTSAGNNRWKLRLDEKLRPDITLAVRMDRNNEKAKDYYLLPTLDICEATLRLADFNGISLDAYRFDTLEFFYRLTSRVSLRAAA